MNERETQMKKKKNRPTPIKSDLEWYRKRVKQMDALRIQIKQELTSDLEAPLFQKGS